MLEAARRYPSNRLERVAVVFASTAAKRSNAFVKALASGVVKQASGKPAQPLGRREMYILLALIRVVVRGLDPDTAKKALTKLLEVQLALVDALIVLSVPWKVRSTCHVLRMVTAWSVSAFMAWHEGCVCNSGQELDFCKQPCCAVCCVHGHGSV